MREFQGWLVDAGTAWIVLGLWFGAVFACGFWRSQGDATADPIRQSGPFG